MQARELQFLAIVCIVQKLFFPAQAALLRTILDTPRDFTKCEMGWKSPSLLVMSFDGVRPDHVEKMPALQAVGQAGLQADHMRPVFPTATFPNHISIVTGVHPETHGIIDNYFTSQDGTKMFEVSKDSRKDPAWWLTDPIWNVAQAQGKRVAALSWPGHDVVINGGQPLNFTTLVDMRARTIEQRVLHILDHLKLPEDKRSHLVLHYYHEPDNAAHKFGFNSPEYLAGLASANQLMELLINKLDEYKLLNCLDIIALSDHGLNGFDKPITPAPTEALTEKFGTFFKVDQAGQTTNRINNLGSPITAKAIVDALFCSSNTSPYQVYLKEDLPRRLHFFNLDVIPPVIITANMTHIVNTKDYSGWMSKGGHGWDNLYRDMRSFFIAYGPSFRRQIPVEPFQNIEVFGLLCEMLGLTVPSFSGTLGSLRYILREAKEETTENSGPQLFGPNIGTVVTQNPPPICAVFCPQLPATVDVPSTENLLKNRFGPLGYPLHDPASAIKPLTIFANEDFITGFSKERGVALWTSFSLTADRQAIGADVFSKPPTCLVPDPRVAALSPIPTCVPDEAASLVLDANFLSLFSLFPTGWAGAKSAVTRYAGILSSNTVPMYATFRTGIWARFWQRALSWVNDDGPINVVIGPVYDSQAPYGFVDNISPATSIPSHFYVVSTRSVARPRCPTVSCQYEVLAFVLPHRPAEKHPCQQDPFYFLTHSATVRDVEQLTGLQFFRGVASATECARLRTRLTSSFWGSNDQPL